MQTKNFEFWTKNNVMARQITSKVKLLAIVLFIRLFVNSNFLKCSRFGVCLETIMFKCVYSENVHTSDSKKMFSSQGNIGRTIKAFDVKIVQTSPSCGTLLGKSEMKVMTRTYVRF